ncbi:MAG: Hint domain-containing protein [Rubellimicrobium sp.]|nr:Hint domain-containing protein [Rubellimicrobium sp.]
MPAPARILSTIPATDFRVTEGVARGEAMGFADELVLDDIYQLAPGAGRRPLELIGDEDDSFRVAATSATGTPGNPVVIDSCATLMERDGTTLEMLILVEIEGTEAAAVHLMPLAPLAPRIDYRLVGLDRHAGTMRLAEAASSSFLRGTRITLATGAQVAVEDLRPGDRILTRDSGPRPLRWIGQTTLRATGAFAPVLIRKGALNNENDLTLSPDHRVFIWQREDRIGAGRAEVLVKVRNLVNGRDVVQLDGGFVDYFQLLFDAHHIIYAEGIAAESLYAGPATRAALPEGLAAARHGPSRHMGYEVKDSLLAPADAVALLRRASEAR